MATFNKIIVGGPQGAGKTTLANILVKELGVPVFYVDRIFYDSKWRERPQEITKIEILQIAALDKWIVDSYWYGIDEILYKTVDLIIFINQNRLLCYINIIKRRIKGVIQTRQETPDNSDNKIYFSLIKKVWVQNREYRLNIIKKLNEGKNATNVIVIDKLNKKVALSLINSIKNN